MMMKKTFLSLLLSSSFLLSCQKEDVVIPDQPFVSASSAAQYALPCRQSYGEGGVAVNYLPSYIDINSFPNPNPGTYPIDYQGLCSINGDLALRKGLTMSWFIGSIVTPGNSVATGVSVQISNRESKKVVFSRSLTAWEDYWFQGGADDLNRTILLQPYDMTAEEIYPLTPGDYIIKITASPGNTIDRSGGTIVTGLLSIGNFASQNPNPM